MTDHVGNDYCFSKKFLVYKNITRKSTGIKRCCYLPGKSIQ